MTVTMSRDQFNRIADRVRADKAAFAALTEGKAQKDAARKAGQIASPPAPPSYSYLYDIMDEVDPRFAAAMGAKVIIELEKALLQDGPAE